MVTYNNQKLSIARNGYLLQEMVTHDNQWLPMITKSYILQETVTYCKKYKKLPIARDNPSNVERYNVDPYNIGGRYRRMYKTSMVHNVETYLHRRHLT